MMPEMLSGVFWNHTLSRVFLRQAQLAANHVRGCSKLSEVCVTLCTRCCPGGYNWAGDLTLSPRDF